MGTYRKRFNEKARAGQMAKLKELKRVRNKQFLRHLDDGSEEAKDEKKQVEDTNSVLLKPMTEEEKEIKKRKLEELFTPKESKVSRTKKKRLEKFIEHQLKREEKKELIGKLQDYKIDTSLLTSSKKLGQGRQTKKERFAEALELEKQGRASELTKDILYEEHDVKEWEGIEGEPKKRTPDYTYSDSDQDLSDNNNESGISNDDDEANDEEDFESKFVNTASSFIDRRPASTGGMGGGFGFGFANVTKVKPLKQTSKKKYNWKQKVAMEEMKRKNVEDMDDFDTSSETDGTDFDSEDNDADQSMEGDHSEHNNEDREDESSDKEVSSEQEHSGDSSSEISDLTDGIENTEKKNVAEEFKSWANNEIRRLEGRDVDVEMPSLSFKVEPTFRPEDMDDGLKQTHIPIDEGLKRKAFFVNVERKPEIMAQRLNLPVVAEEHTIMEAIHHNDVVIICGETGSGKTTQVPQFLYESGYGSPDSTEHGGMIGITQPRRVAAVSMAERVSNELGNHGDKVAYQIRFDSTSKEDTRVKFMTDGVLLRELMEDFLLSKYSAIIIDEAHERNINTDILIGMLSRCVKLRAKKNNEDPKRYNKLKLVIMSATLRVSDFSENSSLFSSPPPILKIEARQFPVSVHFNRKTAFNYADEAFRKTCKIHQRLPPGAILIFMTGQNEITAMVKKLRKRFPFKTKNKSLALEFEATKVKVDPRTAAMEEEDIDLTVHDKDEKRFLEDIEYENENENVTDDNSDDEEGFDEELTDDQTPDDPLYVLPLYSLLPTKEQMKVFESPPKGSRMCIVATNVAETSLTIPGVRYVVDCGRVKERKYNNSNGVQSFEVGWVSKASADQRSGRAGRTGPGHCYRLYSSAVFDRDFEQFSKPEILRMPVESVVLQMKSMAIHNIVNFPFPTPPDKESLKKAIELLQYLGALDDKEKVTEDGKKMSLFPLSPRFSKMLLVSNEHGCMPYIVSIISALSVGDPFLTEQELGIQQAQVVKRDDGNESAQLEFIDSQEVERVKNLRNKFYKSRVKFSKLDKYSDVFKLLSVTCAWNYVPNKQRDDFVRSNFLRRKVMDEIEKLRRQLTYIVKSNTSKESIAINITNEDLRTDLPSEIQLKMLKQMICVGFIDKVAIRADALYPEEAKITNRTVINKIPYLPVMGKLANDVNDSFVYIHPSSMINNIGELPPKFIVYNTLNLSANNVTRLVPLCDIKSTPLANVARKGMLLSYSKPITGQGLKVINIAPTERYCYVVPRFGSQKDSDLQVGWDLNPIPVHQVKQNGVWTVDKFITNKNYKNAEHQRK